MRMLITLVGLGLLLTSAAFAADEGVLVNEPELVVISYLSNQSCAVPGSDYASLKVSETEATLVVSDGPAGEGSRRIGGRGIQRVSWEPAADGRTLVTLKLSSEPLSTVVNSMPGSELKPATPQILLSLGFDPQDTKPASGFLGGGQRGTADDADKYGSYELPPMEQDYKYSDVLVTLRIQNGDFREVLWYLSEIGNVSIILDPYWADEPTGGRRPPGGGVSPGDGGGDDGGSGFRPGDEFIPFAPREGVGNLSLNFTNVPFDTALELVVMSVGLVMVDVSESYSE